MTTTYDVAGEKISIFGLQSERDDWLASQLLPMVQASPRTVDGLSVEPKGVNEKCQLVVEIHGNLTTVQLRLLADAIDNVPSS